MEKDNMTEAQKLEEKLLSKSERAFKSFGVAHEGEINPFCDSYRAFLNASKTEREFTTAAEKLLREKGFVPLERGCEYKAGDKVFLNNRKKSILAAIVGNGELDDGTNIVAAHIDSPRLDLKPNPLYEDGELGYFKTHYYGGIKKYQWTVIPLALHGVVIKKNGETVEIVIGEDECDPALCVTDILPHLSYNVQDERKARDVIKGEELNILLGSTPIDDENIKEPVKLNIMRILNEKYGITEADFRSAELEAVPAFKARDLGLDRSLIGAYAHDDRVCAYAALRAFADADETPSRTAICILADKEETGSEGNTGLDSDILKYFMSRLRSGDPGHALHNSKCLSCDVNVAFDPTFPEVSERRNSAYLNHGPVLTKYTGSRGKSGTSDASAEFVAEIRALLDGAKIPWQTGELGKVDEGGGGTVAKYIASLGADVVDFGVALLSMHAPFEVASKLDIYALYKACLAFYAC
ncbi:MAG: aminopeptidase [Oscillospiraceae bacterium]